MLAAGLLGHPDFKVRELGSSFLSPHVAGFLTRHPDAEVRLRAERAAWEHHRRRAWNLVFGPGPSWRTKADVAPWVNRDGRYVLEGLVASWGYGRSGRPSGEGQFWWCWPHNMAEPDATTAWVNYARSWRTPGVPGLPTSTPWPSCVNPPLPSPGLW